MGILDLIPKIKEIRNKYGITTEDTWVQHKDGSYVGMKSGVIIPKKKYQEMCNELNNLFRKNLNY